MKRIAWFAFVVIAISMIAFPTSAAEKSVIIKLAHSENNENQHGALCKIFKEIVEKETNGGITVQVFPSGQLGNLR